MMSRGASRERNLRYAGLREEARAGNGTYPGLSRRELRVTFRDLTAALERVAVVERENARLRDQLEALKIEYAMLRADGEADKDAIIAELVAERDALAAQLEGHTPAVGPHEAEAEDGPAEVLEDKMRGFLKRFVRRY
jgi:hypothetical protein